MNDQRREDLEEADRLTAAAANLKGSLQDELLSEAAQLRSKWQATNEMVALASASAESRDADLAEADRLADVASDLRAGSPSRVAVEAEVAALRAKWPDFEDNADGQIKRLGAFLLARGLMGPDTVPARAILDLIASLEADLSARKPPASCFYCGIDQPQAGPPPVNEILIAVVKHFETDANFRDQVISGKIKAGQSMMPWIPGYQPNRGPQDETSPWAIARLASLIKSEPKAIAAVGSKLRAVLKERNFAFPESTARTTTSPRLTNGHQH